MDPTAIYVSIFLGAVLVGIGALLVAPNIKRTCPECGSPVPISKRVCRACRYRFI
jgi:predicted amidophosphoribosyltransferase